jgi:MFS family permease
MHDPLIRQQIRSARGKFVAMAASYSLGVFNDNFFKQAAMLLAIDAGRKQFQGWMLFLFTLPFVLFAAPAGWLADRFAKRHIVIGAKGLEVLAMICGAAGLLTGSWPLMIAMVSAMGLQSCIFGPSLNGSIPELYPASYVTAANGTLKVFVTGAIILGVAAAGFVLDGKGTIMDVPAGRLATAIIAFAVAAFGFAASFGVPHRPAAMHDARKFPWTGPLDSVRTIGHCFADRLLGITVVADMFVWFVGSMEILVINVLGKEQLRYSGSATSGMLVAQLGGLAAGGLLAGRLAAGPRWHRVLAPAAMGLAAGMGLVAAAAAGMAEPARYCCVLLGLIVAGLCGGLFMIPCESFVQVRPAPERRGEVISATNFMVFIGIMASAPLANALNEHIRPSISFALLGGLSLLAAAALRLALRREKEA